MVVRVRSYVRQAPGPAPKTLSKESATQLHYGQTLYELGAYNADGTARRWRVSGKTQTWKTRPDEFRVPIKHGMYDNYAIDHHNAQDFTTEEPPALSRRRIRERGTGPGVYG